MPRLPSLQQFLACLGLVEDDPTVPHWALAPTLSHLQRHLRGNTSGPGGQGANILRMLSISFFPEPCWSNAPLRSN